MQSHTIDIFKLYSNYTPSSNYKGIVALKIILLRNTLILKSLKVVSTTYLLCTRETGENIFYLTPKVLFSFS